MKRRSACRPVTCPARPSRLPPTPARTPAAARLRRPNRASSVPPSGRVRVRGRLTSESSGRGGPCRANGPSPPHGWPAATADRWALPAGRLGSRSDAPLADGPSVPGPSGQCPQSYCPQARRPRLWGESAQGPMLPSAHRPSVPTSWSVPRPRPASVTGPWHVSTPAPRSVNHGASTERPLAALRLLSLVISTPSSAPVRSGPRASDVPARRCDWASVRASRALRERPACVRPMRPAPASEAWPGSGLSFPSPLARRAGPSGRPGPPAEGLVFALVARRPRPPWRRSFRPAGPARPGPYRRVVGRWRPPAHRSAAPFEPSVTR